MRKWCRFVCTTIADPILESYRIMPSHWLWRVWPPTSDLVIPTLAYNTRNIRQGANRLRDSGAWQRLMHQACNFVTFANSYQYLHASCVVLTQQSLFFSGNLYSSTKLYFRLKITSRPNTAALGRGGEVKFFPFHNSTHPLLMSMIPATKR